MVEMSFYALTALVVLMMIILFKNHPHPKVLILKYLLVILLWGIYLIIISNSGLLDNFDLPPRLPLLIVVPAILMILFFINRGGLLTVVKKTPLYIPVLLQSFRILVELLIYATFLKGILPQRATFEGLNFDILVGISSIFIGLAALRGIISLKGLIIWNILSLCILAVTVYAFISTYYFTDYVLTSESRKLIELPYLLLPSYLLPLAVFLHIFSIKQILIKRQAK